MGHRVGGIPTTSGWGLRLGGTDPPPRSGVVGAWSLGKGRGVKPRFHSSSVPFLTPFLLIVFCLSNLLQMTEEVSCRAFLQYSVSVLSVFFFCTKNLWHCSGAAVFGVTSSWTTFRSPRCIFGSRGLLFLRPEGPLPNKASSQPTTSDPIQPTPTPGSTECWLQFSQLSRKQTRQNF